MKYWGINLIKWLNTLPVQKQTNALLLCLLFVAGVVIMNLSKKLDTRDSFWRAREDAQTAKYEDMFAKQATEINDIKDKANQEVQDFYRNTIKKLEENNKNAAETNKERKKMKSINEKVIKKQQVIINKLGNEKK